MRIAALAFLLLLAVAAEAGACSCIGESPQQKMASADAAFVGTVTAVRTEGRRRVYTVAVEKAYKGPVGEVAEVRGEDPEQGGFSSCSEVYKVGETLGGFFRGAPEEWSIFTCNRATREELEAGAAGFPAPGGSGRAVALLTGPIGDGSPLAALDAQGRVIAYAKGSAPSNAVWVSACPGGRRVVESTFESVRTRRLSDLAVLRTHRKRLAAVACADESGRKVMGAGADGRLWRLSGAKARRLTGVMAMVAPGRRASLAIDAGERLLRVDSRTGAIRLLGRVRDVMDLSVSPDGTRLAALAGKRILVFTASGRRLAAVRTRGGYEQIAWNDRRPFALPLRRHGGAVVGDRVWWVRGGVLRAARSGYGAASSVARVPEVSGARVIALPRPVTVSDPSRFNPSASGGSPPRARRARAGGGAPRGDCPRA